MKIRLVRAELFHIDRQTDGQTERQADKRTDRQTDRQTDGQTDRQTDMTKLTVAFRSFANAPKSDQLDGAHNKGTHSSLRIPYTVGHAL